MSLKSPFYRLFKANNTCGLALRSAQFFDICYSIVVWPNLERVIFLFSVLGFLLSDRGLPVHQFASIFALE